MCWCDFFFLRIRRPTSATRTDTLVPDTTLFPSPTAWRNSAASTLSSGTGSPAIGTYGVGASSWATVVVVVVLVVETACCLVLPCWLHPAAASATETSMQTPRLTGARAGSGPTPQIGRASCRARVCQYV